MNRTRFWSGVCGLVVVIFGIWLERRGYEVQAQIFVLTAVALAGPFGVAIVSRALRNRLLPTAVISCGIIHTFFMWMLWKQLPLRTLGVAILLGFAEALVFVLLSAKILESSPREH